MKTFLLKYWRREGWLEECREVAPEDLEAARAERLRLEIAALCHGADLEVVLLEAESLEALRSTHSRYFLSLRELSEAARETMRASAWWAAETARLLLATDAEARGLVFEGDDD